MANKSTGKHYTSKGERSNVSRKTRNDVRSNVSVIDKHMNKFNAYLKGGNPWITVPNSNKNETNKRMIKIRANDLWGNPKNFGMVDIYNKKAS